MNELLPSLTGGKMSSSHAPHTKIMFLDDAATVDSKIAGATCPPGCTQGNGILPIVEHILMPVSEIRMNQHRAELENGAGRPCVGRLGAFAAKGAPEGTLFSIGKTAGADKGHSHHNYFTFEELESDYTAGLIEPEALKEAVASALNHLLQPIRELYSEDGDWRCADKMGYPEDWSGLHEAAVLCPNGTGK